MVGHMVGRFREVLLALLLASFYVADYGVMSVELVAEHALVWMTVRVQSSICSLLQPWHVKSYQSCDYTMNLCKGCDNPINIFKGTC